MLKVTGTSFYMDTYDARTNKKLIEIASRFGYKIDFVVDTEKSVVTEIKDLHHISTIGNFYQKSVESSPVFDSMIFLKNFGILTNS